MSSGRIIDRLDQYMKFKGINDNQVTVNAALSVGLIGNARRGTHDLGKKAVDKILNFYQDINRAWLLTGEGEMLSCHGNVPEDRKPALIRILEILLKNGVSLQEFDRRTGKHFGEFFFNNAIKCPWDNEKAIREWADLVVKSFPDYSLDWIMTGKEKTRTDIIPVQTFPLKTDLQVELQEVPLYDLTATAGLVAIFNNVLPDPVDHLRIPNLPPVDGAIYARGDSMSPLIASGDIVIFKKVELHPDNIIWGSIYIISYTLDGDDFTVLKYVRHSSKDGYIRLESFNPRFDPQDIPSSSITALALVKASITFHTIG